MLVQIDTPDAATPDADADAADTFDTLPRHAAAMAPPTLRAARAAQRAASAPQMPCAERMRRNSAACAYMRGEVSAKYSAASGAFSPRAFLSPPFRRQMIFRFIFIFRYVATLSPLLPPRCFRATPSPLIISSPVVSPLFTIFYYFSRRCFSLRFRCRFLLRHAMMLILLRHIAMTFFARFLRRLHVPSSCLTPPRLPRSSFRVILLYVFRRRCFSPRHDATLIVQVARWVAVLAARVQVRM